MSDRKHCPDCDNADPTTMRGLDCNTCGGSGWVAYVEAVVPDGYDDPPGFTWTSGSHEYRIVNLPTPGSAGHFYAGWLLSRHPDGQWVTILNLRPALASICAESLGGDTGEDRAG